jgi:hypothetical protein
MKISTKSPWVMASAAACAAGLLLSPLMSHPAHACGGFWCSQTAPVNQAAEEIIFVDNPDSTVTAIIQIKYVGPSQKFAWVIPMPGKPTVDVSSNTAFQRLDNATAPQYRLEVTVEGMCMQQYYPTAFGNTATGASAPQAGAAMDSKSAVTVIDMGSVGPYDYTTIAVDPSLAGKDAAKVATDWFTANGYDLTTLDSAVLSPYLNDGLNLLAFKLTKGTDTGAIRPVVLTYESKLPAVPIRPTAVAAQDDMGIQIWVVGPSQAIPDNYKSLVINEALIDWLSGPQYMTGTLPATGPGALKPVGGPGFYPYSQKPSNYDAVVTAAANEAGGQGFVTELGAKSADYKDLVWSSMDDQTFAMISSQSYADGIDAIFMANQYYRGWDGWKDAIQGATTLPAGVTIDEFGRNPDMYRGTAKVDTTMFFKLLNEKVVKPVADTAMMMVKAPYLTRLYSTMSSDEMTVDPAFNYNAELADVSNVHTAKQFIECSPNLYPYDAPWRIELPQGGVIVGKGNGNQWPVAEGSMPANLKIVQLSSTGPGKVVTDNSGSIGAMLFKTAGTTGTGTAMTEPPKTGVMIGGTQMVTPNAQTNPTHGTTAPRPSGSNKCSVSRVGEGRSSALALLLPLVGAVLAMRRRRPQC